MNLIISDSYSRSSGLAGLGQGPAAVPADGASYPFPVWAVNGIDSQADLKGFRVARAAAQFMYKFLRENGANPNAGAQLYTLVETDKAAGSTSNPSDALAGEAIGAWTIFRLNSSRKDVLRDIASVKTAEEFENAVIAQYYKFTPTMFFNGGSAANMAVKAADRVLKDSFSAGAKNTSVVGNYADLALGATFAAAIGFPNVLNRNSENAAVVSNLIETANFSSGPFLTKIPAADKDASLFSLVPPEYFDRILFTSVVLLFVTAGASKYYAYRQEKKAKDREYSIMRDRVRRGLSI